MKQLAREITLLPNIHYPNNPLKQVIVRIDWLSEISEIRSELSKELSSSVRVKFPKLEPREVFRADINIGINKNEVVRRALEFYEWHFTTEDKTKKLTLTKDALFISYERYSSFEELLEDFVPIANTLFARFPNLQSKRLGLRYLNQIVRQGGDPLVWNELINPDLLYPIENLPDHENVVRELNKIEFRYDTFNLRYSFGIDNPDFPAQILQRIFLLDLDAYSQDLVDGDGITDLLNSFHTKIQEFFEFSITDRLRGTMNDGNR